MTFFSISRIKSLRSISCKIQNALKAYIIKHVNTTAELGPNMISLSTFSLNFISTLILIVAIEFLNNVYYFKVYQE